jgi:hypothetical protein
MTGRFGRDQFIGDLGAERSQQVEVTDEERQMGVVGNRVEGVYFEGKMAPVLKKLAHHRQRQRAGAQLGHEGAVVNLPIGIFVKRLIQIVDVGGGVLFAKFFTCLGFFDRAH